ncbi:MAG: phosphoribosylformylglycinamidine cyclo-ligase [Magnetococcales bacterium]|nr:phosphoribosylformylglycinamidine cyclo-ligase [Magnetococcales bacterium]
MPSEKNQIISSSPTTPDPAKAPSLTYRDAGVDIESGYKVVSLIKKAVESTRRPEVGSSLGGFGGLFNLDTEKFKEPVLVSATDGVGTKLKLAFLMERHDTVGIDLVAMSVNDLIVQGAEPLFFLDYFATGKLHPETAATVVTGIAAGCREAGCALIGGETAEMPDFYAPGEYDLAGFAVGAVDKSKIIDGTGIAPGDALIGLTSSGPHSNGYSLIRRLVLGEGGPGLEAPFEGGTLGEALLTPTRIYVRAVLEMAEQNLIKGLAHITGGGFQENVPRMLPDQVAVDLDPWPWPPIFHRLMELGNIEKKEMEKTFNCGIGMVVAVAEGDVDSALDILKKSDTDARLLGRVRARNGNESQVMIRD